MDTDTGELYQDAVVHAFVRIQAWSDPKTQRTHTWNERVLLARASAYQAGLRRLRE